MSIQKIIKLKYGDRAFGCDAEIDKLNEEAELAIWKNEQVEIVTLNYTEINELIDFLYSVKEEMRGE